MLLITYHENKTHVVLTVDILIPELYVNINDNTRSDFESCVNISIYDKERLISQFTLEFSFEVSDEIVDD